LVTQFDTFVGGHLMGGPGQNEFQQELRRLAEDFQRRLKTLRPTPIYFQTIEQENEVASQIESPRKGDTSRPSRWEREGSPTLTTRRGRKAGAGVEVCTVSSDSENAVKLASPPFGSRKRRNGTDSALSTVTKKSKRGSGATANSISEQSWSHNSPPFPSDSGLTSSPTRSTQAHPSPDPAHHRIDCDSSHSRAG
jgi:hypothetical protein